MTDVTRPEAEKEYQKLKKEAESAGYRLNSDEELVRDLVEGLLVNEKRYGYRSCPCRLASGSKAQDLDIICPCDYRDPDLNDYGACYCGLYVSEGRPMDDNTVVPERRFSGDEKDKKAPPGRNIPAVKLPVWRCKVCGYLCARENPPEICPICKVKKDRFEVFIKPG